MNDDELRDALARRASRLLTGDDRNDVIRAARVRALEPHRRSFAPRIAGWLAAAVGVVILVLVVAPILLSPPTQVARSSQSPIASASGTPNASQLPTGQVDIYSAVELANMIGDPHWVGQTVLANAAIAPVRTPECPAAPQPCNLGTLNGASGNGSGPIVSIGWRDAPGGPDAPTGVGTIYADDSGMHWVVPIDLPSSPGVFAFTIRADSVEYLGPAELGPDSRPLRVGDVPANQERTATDSVYVVSGWWSAGLWPSCPAYPGPPRDMSFYCTGFWLTSAPPQNSSSMVPPEGGLQLAGGEYPAWSDQHSPGAPVPGVYVIRSAGRCQLTLDGRCPTWRMLARLQDQSTAPTPSPTPTAVPLGLPTYTAQQLSDMIGDPQWVGKTVLGLVTIAGNYVPPCPTKDAPCGGQLEDATGRTFVSIGARDATPEDGVQIDDGSGYRWVKALQLPAYRGLFAFLVGSDSVEYLGPAKLSSDGYALNVTDLAGASSDPSDDVYVVSGWLMHTLEAPCAFPQQGLASPMPDISSYYCGGSWLTDQAVGSPTSGLTIDGGLHVQGDAYNTFAIDPQPADGGGYQPRQGIHLIRNAGCPEVVTGDCPVWRMVGRLDTDSLQPLPTVSPSFAEGVKTTSFDGIQFDYPSSWKLDVVDHYNHYDAVLAFVTTGGATAISTCTPDYQPGAGSCSSSYDVSTGGAVIAVLQGDGPPGNDRLRSVLDNGWQPTTVAGQTAAFDLNYTDPLVPASNQGVAWIVEAPGTEGLLTYTVEGFGNGFPGLEETVADIVGSMVFTNEPPIPTTPAPLPTEAASSVSYIHLDRAVAIAEQQVGAGYTIRSYAPGHFEEVVQILFGPWAAQFPPPHGATDQSMVWGVMFAKGSQLQTVYIDLFDGTVLGTDERPAPGQLAKPHKSDITFAPPTIVAYNETDLDVSVYVADELAATIPAHGDTTIDPTMFGPAPWSVTTKTTTGRQLTTGVLDPATVWGTTGDYPLSGQTWLERIDLSCGRLDLWAGGEASGPGPGPSFPPNDCVP